MKETRVGVLDGTYAVDRKKRQEVKFRYRVRAQVVAGVVKQHFPLNRSVQLLDLGAAEGQTLLELKTLLPGSEFTGVEFSEELIEAAPPLPDSIHLIEGDVERLPVSVKVRRFDIVSALAILEHLNSPLQALYEAFTVLRPGGLVVVTCPNPFWDHVSNSLGLLKGGQHETDLDKKHMIDVARQAGFTDIIYERFMFAPVAVLPYLGIRVSPEFSIKVDRCLRRIWLLNWLFVNQSIVARKPGKPG